MEIKIQPKSFDPQEMANQKQNKQNSLPQRAFRASKGDQVSFTGKGNLTKRAWLALKNLSGEMADVTEVTNAVIAAIGTGIIAPLVILGSPGKGDKEDKDKKAFQALRQPLSAFLALGFQLPATYVVNAGINKLAYETDKGILKDSPVSKVLHKFFDDETLGTLIEDKKYIKKNVTKDEIAAIETEFNAADSPLRKKLEEKIIANSEEVGLSMSAEELEKEVAKKKKGFLVDEVVARKYDSQIDAKCAEMMGKNVNIEPKDLVTEDLKNLVGHDNKAALDAIEADMKLSPLDKLARSLGFETDKLKELKKKQDAFKTEKGVELLKEKDPDIITNAEKRIRNFVESKNGKAQKIFANKKFWLSLVVNLGMVSASCYALNWAHPKMKALIDKIRGKRQSKKEENAVNNQVAEATNKPAETTVKPVEPVKPVETTTVANDTVNKTVNANDTTTNVTTTGDSASGNLIVQALDNPQEKKDEVK